MVQANGALSLLRVFLGHLHDDADAPQSFALLARAASGHATAAPPRSVTKSRRFN
jgi:hypothetical protein